MPQMPTFVLRKPRGAVKWTLVTLVVAFLAAAVASRTSTTAAAAVELLKFDPAAILHGERVWSPFTFWLVNRLDSPFDLLFAGIAIYFFGAALEDAWGTRRFLLFMASVQLGAAALALIGATLHLGAAPIAGTSPLAAAMVVAWGLANPKQEMYFFFFPLKGSHLVLITVGFAVFNGFMGGLYAVAAQFGGMIAAAGWALAARGPLRRMVLERKLKHLEHERELLRRGSDAGDDGATAKSLPALRFRLFGVGVEVRLFFWVVTLFMGWSLAAEEGRPLLLAIWVAIVFVSVLVHEFGHALAIKRHGIQPAIALHGFGGTTTHRTGGRLLSRPAQAFISFAGPLAGFALGGIVYLGMWLAGPALQTMPLAASFAIETLVFVNIGWGLFNLLPVLPFDGGHILEQALGPERARIAAILSIVVAVAVGVACVVFFRWYWAAALMALSVFQTYPRLTATEGATPGSGRRDVRTEAARRAAAARLRVISGGKDDDAKRWLN